MIGGTLYTHQENIHEYKIMYNVLLINRCAKLQVIYNFIKVNLFTQCFKFLNDILATVST